jgi:uncharacterized protein YjcR
MDKANTPRPQLNRDYTALKFEAAVLYIKQAMPVKMICQQLKISTKKISEWIKADHWNDLRQHPNSKINPKMISLQQKAAVLYIKHGLSAAAICKQLKVTLPTITKWSKADRWDDLRPDHEALTEYKAANLYINENLTTGEIAQKLSVSESIISMWIDINGWDASKLVTNTENIISNVLADFCSHFKKLFPGEATMIEFVQNDYLKNLNTKLITKC